MVIEARGSELCPLAFVWLVWAGWCLHLHNKAKNRTPHTRSAPPIDMALRQALLSFVSAQASCPSNVSFCRASLPSSFSSMFLPSPHLHTSLWS